jgi:signal peptidase II
MTDTPPSESPAAPEEQTAQRSRWGRRISPLSASIALVFVIVDQVTKSWAVSALDDGRIIEVLGSLQFNLSFNSGMAFGRGQGFGPVIGVVALVVIVYLLLGLRMEGSRLGMIAVGMVMGGAAGNVVDRLFRGEGWFRGAVVDFIDLQWWPVFNVADIGVTVGGLLLVIGSLFARPRQSAAR